MGSNTTNYDYGFQIYNPSIGKFLSVDPLKGDYPYYTPYQFAGNMPIWAIDLDGLEEWKTNNGPIQGPYRDQFEAEDASKEEAQSTGGHVFNTPEENAYNDIATNHNHVIVGDAGVKERGEMMFGVLRGYKEGGLDYIDAYYKAQLVYIPFAIRNGIMLGAKYLPQGFSKAKFSEFSKILREVIANFGDDLAVHGSRANGTAKLSSDIDIAIRVSQAEFNALIKESFGSPNVGSALEKTMLHAIKTGKIQRGELGLSKLGKSLEARFGYKVDISAILKGGKFDKGPYIPLGN